MVEAFWLVGLALLTNLLTNVRAPFIHGTLQLTELHRFTGRRPDHLKLLTATIVFVVSVHLVFDCVLWGILVHAHNPEWLPIFISY